jgi:integrase
MMTPNRVLRGSHPAASATESKGHVWTVDEARRFLESARHDCDPLYAAYVLILVLGLRKGGILGLTWDRVDLDAAELYVGEQLQRVRGSLIRRPVKTESSEAPLPLPELSVTALKLRYERQATVSRLEVGGSKPGWSS